MRRVHVWMFGLSLAAAGLIGCEGDKKGEEMTQAPPQEPVQTFPEAQVPAPEPQPAGSPRAEAYEPPVDTTATASAGSPESTPMPKESYAPPVPKQARTYVVRPGDTLSKISQKFYHTPGKWRTIYTANRQVLAGGPDKLQVGMKLAIP